MVMRRRRFPRRAGSRRRQLVWARSSNTPAGTSVAVGTVVAADLLADYVTQSGGDSLNGATLMAVRGRIWASVITTRDLPSFLAWGIRQDDSTQVALPAAQLLATRGVVTTGRYGDWLARDYFWTPITADESAEGASWEYPGLMLRSRRRLSELNDTIALYAEVPAGSEDVGFTFQLDLLLALP